MPGDRSIDPRNYVDSVIDILTERKARFIEHTEITKVVSTGDRIRSVETSSGTVDGEEFVLTAGAGSRLLAKKFDLHLSVIPGQGYNVGLPTSPGLQQPVIFEEVHAVATPFEDRIRLGGTMEFGGDNPPFDERRIEAIIASMRKFLDLDWDQRFDTWAGLAADEPRWTAVHGPTEAMEQRRRRCRAWHVRPHAGPSERRGHRRIDHDRANIERHQRVRSRSQPVASTEADRLTIRCQDPPTSSPQMSLST